MGLALALSVTIQRSGTPQDLCCQVIMHSAHLSDGLLAELLTGPEVLYDICEVPDDASVSSRSLGTPSCSDTSSAALRFDRRRANDCEVESVRASDPAMVTKLPWDSKSETLRSFIEPRVQTLD